MRIGIDLMGGDTPPHILFEAVLIAAQQLDAFHTLVVIATKSVVNKLSQQIHPSSKAYIEFRSVAESIAMADEPLRAFKRKKRSSLVVGIGLLKKGLIDAFVSCGNSGALVGGVTLSLPKLPGIHRAALLAFLPSAKGAVAVLDVGGNVACKAHHLVQFAYLGVAYQRALHQTKTPAVGFLNIGVESGKGTKEVRQAYEELQRQSQELLEKGVPPRMHFVGNVEGRDIFNGIVDVLITDGFTGNVLLKATEGVASFILDKLQHKLNDNSPGIINATLKDLQKQFNYAEYPGAIICGMDGIVIKAHGSSSVQAFLSSILGAADLVDRQVLSLIKEQLF